MVYEPRSVSGQWTLDDLRASGRKPERPDGALFYFYGPVAPPRVPSQREFDDEFRDRAMRLGGQSFVNLLTKLLSLPNVLLCGGAVCSAVVPLDPSRLSRESDFDWFVYGLNDTRDMWRVASEFVDAVRDAFLYDGGGSSQSCSVSLCGSVLSIRTDLFPKIQLVLRAFDRREDITEGFDIGFCGMSYDGKVTTLTERAAESVLNRTITIEPERASKTYESRIIKYMKRYGLMLSAPGMDPPVIPGIIELMRLAIDVLEPPNEYGASVDLILRRPPDAWPMVPKSDYDVLSSYCDEQYGPAVRNWELYHNVAAVIGGGDYAMIRGLFEDDMSWEKAAVVGHLTVSDFLDYDDYDFVLSRMCRGTTLREGSVDYRDLVKYLGFSDEEAAAIMRALSEHGELDVGDSLERRKQAMLERFRSIADSKVGNWRIERPGAQENGSLNPEPMDARAYYGSEYRESPKSRAGPERGDADAPVCLICLGAVRCDTNRVVLACSHVFHFGGTAACGGLIAWTRAGNDTCPCCMAEISKVTKPADSAERPLRVVRAHPIADMMASLRV